MAVGALILVFLIIFYFSLPDPLFEDPYSTVLEDRNGNLLSASIADDGQWRFPLQQDVPEKFKVAIVHFEDKRFHSHWGVDPWAIGRALRQNVQAGRIVSGGSTITMQVMRLARKNQARTFIEKAIETIQSFRLEFALTKEEILAYYASHAPFGGNVVGIEAAAWRYFGRRVDQMSWAEACMLAVLPNNPSLIHLGRNRVELKLKRDRLLLRLKDAGEIDEITYELAVSEPIPENPHALPQRAKHLLVRARVEGNDQKKIRSTIDERIQIQSERVVDDHFRRISGNQVFNAAAIILKVETGEVLAYVGNTNAGSDHQEMVDVVSAPRSTGSILKPFLYAAMMDEGEMLPRTLVSDVPTVISGFSPKNFSREYDGAVPADQALIRSLNIPAVLELQEYQY
ncbi:MAG TPA: transglycosylase domain-containing protein, partial [Cyclobacteriaceae bacterium]|nr:transglycosylase domain-containing protein [Cyclobacteriaceae bacterium]